MITRNMAQPTEETVCEECGLRRTEWTGNNGHGVEAHGVLACCMGCCEGIGCTCKETGVRRVVVVNNEQKKNAYVKKMDRQMKDWETRIRDLEKRSQSRKAEQNVSIKKEMTELRQRVSKAQNDLADVKSSRGNWSQKARGASAEYRRMKAVAEDLGHRVKKK